MTPLRPTSPVSPAMPPTPTAAPITPLSPADSSKKPSFMLKNSKQAGPSEDRDFVRSLGLLWRPDRPRGGQLQTVVDLQEAFASDDGWNLVDEVSRILGEAHADKLRTGNGLPPSVERQVMAEAFSRSFDLLVVELKDTVKNPDSFDDIFRVAACSAKDAFQSLGDAAAFRRRTHSLEVLRKDFLKANLNDLLEFRQKSNWSEYLPALSKKLPLLLEHYKKMPASAAKSQLKPDLDLLTNEALLFNGLLAICGIHSGNRILTEVLEATPPEDCRPGLKKSAPIDWNPPASTPNSKQILDF